MVIECAHCQTRFKLADDKLRPEGTKVRCSKCKEIFTVFPPDTEEAPAVPAPPPVAPPAPTPPLSPPAAASDIDFGSLTMDAPPAPDESDFSFDMESVAENAPAPGMSLDMEDIATSSGGISTSSTDETTHAPAATGMDFGEVSFDTTSTTQPATATSAVDESNPFGEFDFGEPPAAEATPAPATADDNFGFGASPATDFDFGDTPSDPTAFNFSEQTAAEPAGSSGADDFNFESMSFGDDTAKPAMPEPPRTAPPSPPPSLANELPPMREPLPPREPSPGRGTARRARHLDTPLPKPGRRISIVTILLTLVIVLLLGVVGAAVYFYFQPGLFDTRKTISDLISKSATQVETGKITVTTQSAGYVNSTDSGALFVIRGEALNEFKTPRTAIAVKGMLFDAQGQILKAQTAFCGNPLSDATLASIPFKKIEDAMANQFGDSLANLDVAPGKAIPFVIVFRQLPADLATYTVELVEARPAAQ